MRFLLTIASLFLALSAFHASAEDVCVTNEAGIEYCDQASNVEMYAEIFAGKQWNHLGCAASSHICKARAKAKGYSEAKWALGGCNNKPAPRLSCFGR